MQMVPTSKASLERAATLCEHLPILVTSEMPLSACHSSAQH